MPTLAAGNNNAYTRIRSAPVHAGFTLLELLLVVAIVAIVTAGASLSLRDSVQSQLESEGYRLAAYLEQGRAQSRASGVPVYWQATSAGFTLNDKPLRWQHEGVFSPIRERIALGPDPIIAAHSITLRTSVHPAYRVQVFTDGLRPFAVESFTDTGAAP